MVDDLALHIVHRGIYDAHNVAKINIHLTVVGIGHDANLRLHGVIIRSIERTYIPITFRLALWLALVISRGAEPDGV